MPTRILMTCLLFAVILYAGYDTLAPKADGTYRDQVAVLMYHHVHDTDHSASTVSTALFREQLSYLLSRGYHFISLGDFKQFLAGGPVPDKAVLVTFDDGYKSFHDFAYPILRELQVPAVNFIITKDLDTPLAPSIPALSPEEIQAMMREMPGLIDAQCHTNALHFKEGKIRRPDRQAPASGRPDRNGGGGRAAGAAGQRSLCPQARRTVWTRRSRRYFRVSLWDLYAADAGDHLGCRLPVRLHHCR